MPAADVFDNHETIIIIIIIICQTYTRCLSVVMQHRELLQKLATAQRISSSNRGAAMHRRRVQCK